MTEEELDLAEWGAEFENEEASGGLDDDDTSCEGYTSEDSATKESSQSFGASEKDEDLAQNDENYDLGTDETKSNRYTRDPSANMYGNIGYVASEDQYYSSRLDEGESLLNSIVEDHILCARIRTCSK